MDWAVTIVGLAVGAGMGLRLLRDRACTDRASGPVAAPRRAPSSSTSSSPETVVGSLVAGPRLSELPDDVRRMLGTLAARADQARPHLTDDDRLALHTITSVELPALVDAWLADPPTARDENLPLLRLAVEAAATRVARLHQFAERSASTPTRHAARVLIDKYAEPAHPLNLDPVTLVEPGAGDTALATRPRTTRRRPRTEPQVVPCITGEVRYVATGLVVDQVEPGARVHFVQPRARIRRASGAWIKRVVSGAVIEELTDCFVDHVEAGAVIERARGCTFGYLEPGAKVLHLTDCTVVRALP